MKSVNIGCSHLQNDSYIRKITHVYTCGPTTISIQLKTFWSDCFLFYYSTVSLKKPLQEDKEQWFSFIFISCSSSTDCRLSATHSHLCQWLNYSYIFRGEKTIKSSHIYQTIIFQSFFITLNLNQFFIMLCNKELRFVRKLKLH